MLNTARFVLFSIIPIIQDVLLVALFVRGLLILRKRKTVNHARLVSLSSILLWVGSICGGVISVSLTLYGAKAMPVVVWCLFEVFVLGCIAMQLAYCKETITYDDEKFEASTFLGRKRTYRYGEITGIRQKGNDTLLYCGHRKIRIDTMASGCEEFVAYADKAYRRQHGGFIPLHDAKKDPMNGNLDAPWLYFILFLFEIAVSIFMICLSISFLWPADDSLPDDTVEICTSFSSYEYTKKDDGTLLLHTESSEKPFSLSYLSEYDVPVPSPEELCSGENYTVIIREGKRENWIYSLLTADRQPIITAYDYNTAYRNSGFVACILLIIFGVIGIAIGILGILVGRHPERFPVWFYQLFYRDSAWTFSAGETHRPHAKCRRSR